MSFDDQPHVSGPYTEDPTIYAYDSRAAARLLSRALTEAYVYADEHSRLIAARVYYDGEPQADVFATGAAPTTVLLAEGIVVPDHASRIVAFEYGVTAGDNLQVLRRLTLVGTPDLAAETTTADQQGQWAVDIEDAAVDRENLTITVAVAAHVSGQTASALGRRVRSVSLWWEP